MPVRRSPASDRESNIKFMQTLDKAIYKQLKTMAKERGITVQELLRAIVVPDWLRFDENSHRRT